MSSDPLNLPIPEVFVYGLSVPPDGQRFAHYASNQVAHSIITHREFWLRNALLMNDFSEIGYGESCLAYSFRMGTLDMLAAALDAIQPNTWVKVKEKYQDLQSILATRTYLACLTEHSDTDDAHGRLSMWRGYGTFDSAAIVLTAAAIKQIGFPGAYFRKVQYWTAEQVNADLRSRSDQLQGARAVLKDVDPSVFVDWVFALLRDVALCTKHPAFFEEHEWRLIISATLQEATASHKPVIKFPRGKMEEVIVIRLDDAVAGNDFVSGAAWLDRIIVGPCDNSAAVRMAYVSLLRGKAINSSSPENVVFCSGVPLRRQ